METERWDWRKVFLRCCLPYPFPSLFVPPSPYSSKLNISTSKQALLKKNNELIVQVMERQKDAVAAAPDQTSEAATTVEVQGGGDQEEGGECKAGGGGRRRKHRYKRGTKGGIAAVRGNDQGIER